MGSLLSDRDSKFSTFGYGQSYPYSQHYTYKPTETLELFPDPDVSIILKIACYLPWHHLCVTSYWLYVTLSGTRKDSSPQELLLHVQVQGRQGRAG